MNKGAFFSNNKTTQEFVYRTNIDSGTTSNFIFTFNNINNKKRIHYNPDYLGFNFFVEPPITGTPPYYTQKINFNYSGDPGIVKTISVKSNDLSKIVFLNGNSQKIYGDINLNGLVGLNQIQLTGNPNLTGVTHIYLNNVSNYDLSNNNIIGTHDIRLLPNINSFFSINDNPNLTKILHTGSTNGWIQYQAHNCNLTGNHDMSMLVGSNGFPSYFFIHNNPNLTGITHANTLQPYSLYYAYNCNLTGNHNVSMLSGLSGEFRLENNSNLTSVTHSLNNNGFSYYSLQYCNLLGNHNISMLNGLGGVFVMNSNPNLTGVTHAANNNIFNYYNLENCNLIGEHDVSMLSGLSDTFILNQNPNLTNVKHSLNNNIFTQYDISSCNLSGNYDISMLNGLGGNFSLTNNPNLTGVTHSLNYNTFTLYDISSCNLSGNHNISMLKNLGGVLKLNNNLNLTNITLPTLTGGSFSKKSVFTPISIDMGDCPNLNFVDFYPLSGSDLSDCSINLSNNNMIASNVNQMLVNFDNITTLNHPKWSGITLTIGGTNSSPDSSSGGYNGINAINNLTGSPKNWVITY